METSKINPTPIFPDMEYKITGDEVAIKSALRIKFDDGLYRSIICQQSYKFDASVDIVDRVKETNWLFLREIYSIMMFGDTSKDSLFSKSIAPDKDQSEEKERFAYEKFGPEWRIMLGYEKGRE